MAKGGLSKIIVKCDPVLKAFVYKDEEFATGVIKALWAYIKKNDLMVKENKKGE